MWGSWKLSGGLKGTGMSRRYFRRKQRIMGRFDNNSLSSPKKKRHHGIQSLRNLFR